MQDKELLEKLRNRDRSAIEYLCSNTFKVIENYVRKNGGQAEDARDIFQDAVLVLFDKLRKKDVQIEKSVLAYFIGIARYLMLRKKTKEARIPLDQFTDINLNDIKELEIIAAKREQYELFYKHYERLDKDCKRILQLFFDKKTMTEIRRLMGLSSIAYAKKKKFVCQKRLINSIKTDSLYNELRTYNG